VPTYEYACTACGERLEAVQGFNDPPLTVCPACAGRLRKVFSPVGVVFKGSGFYKTDSRAASKKPAAASTSSNGAGESTGSEGAGSAADAAASSKDAPSVTSTEPAKPAGDKPAGSATGSDSGMSSSTGDGSKVA
jgi:putative FmdB family regulatory protein